MEGEHLLRREVLKEGGYGGQTIYQGNLRQWGKEVAKS